MIAKEESSELQQARSNATTSMPWKPTNKTCIATDIVKRAMLKLDTKLYGGQVYKKVPEGRYAYVKAGSVLHFLHSLLCNPQIADVLAPHIHSVCSILTFKGCEIIKPLVIDFNVVEVKPSGTCFSFSDKGFKENVIQEDNIGDYHCYYHYKNTTLETSKRIDLKSL